LDEEAMEQLMMLEVVGAKELVNLLKGFEDVFVHVSSFPDVEKRPCGMDDVPLGHGGQEGRKVEIVGRRTEHADGGEREGLSVLSLLSVLSVLVNIAEESKQAEEVAEVAARDREDPCPHVFGQERGR
jgi:hypothetical protein